jgi:hypothetical protein
LNFRYCLLRPYLPYNATDVPKMLMDKMRKLILLSPALTFFFGLAGIVHGQAPPFTCSVNVAVPSILRAEGLDELAGDLTMNCTGGTPTPAGQPFPQFNFTVLLSTNLTSKLTAGNQFTEALLTVDEPASAVNPTRPLLNCGNTGAPDNGTLGPGVCSIVSTGTPTLSYDGTVNGYGAAVCDGGGGRPASNVYGCGRPNVFQGRLGTPQSPGQLNAITFFSVPVDPPGAGVTRTFRFTNLRINAVSVGLSSTSQANVVQATVTAAGPLPMTISNPVQQVAFIQQGLATGAISCPGTAPVVCIQEGFAASWRPKNISFAVGNGIPGNANLPPSQSYWVYAGGTNYPPDVAQNVPGAIYNSETGFEWQNNSPNGPPSPNPPQGIGTVTVQQDLSGPLNSLGFGGLNTGINTSGVANSGTRIAIKFTGVPQGASIQVPAVVTLTSSTSNSSGVMVLTSTDSAGAGPYTPQTGTVTVTNNLAVYEVLWASPFSVETAAVPYTVVNGSPSSVQAAASFAPFYSDSGSQQASLTDPVPRFLNSSQLCADQSCLNVNPSQGVNSGPIQISITNFGSQSLTGAQAVLRAAGMSDIPGTGVSNPAANNLSAMFDLTNAPIGARDVVVTPAGQSSITLAGGFSVLAAAACAYSAGPENSSFPAAGGSGSLVVSANPVQCPWTTNATVSWITLLPVSPALPLVQPFSVAANAGAQRSGTIMIAGTLVTVTQAAASSCGYGIGPGSNLFSANGGNFTINVTAGAGCAWSATSSASWVTFPGSSSGSGNGSVGITVAPNTAGFQSATVTIGGQTFNVTQSASSCGGTDVSFQVPVTRRALLSGWGSAIQYTQQLQLTNTGPSVGGPVYVVIFGLCNPFAQACPFSNGFSSTPVHCQSGQAVGYPAVLIAPNGITAGQTLSYDLPFYENPYENPITPHPSSGITISVISGTPGVQ